MDMSRGICMPDTMLGSLQSLALNLRKVRCSPHFTDREIEAQRDDSSCTANKWWSWALNWALRPHRFLFHSAGKEPTFQCRRSIRCWFDPWVRKIPWRRAW